MPEPALAATAAPAPAAVEAAAVEADAPAAVPAVDGPPAARKPRRRGRTALIMAVAVVLGAVGGAAVGYAVQQSRPPTPLPPLAGTQPSYPAVHSSAAALSAADDDQVKTDGDLIKLLVPAPHGATKLTGSDQIDSWMDAADYAESYEKPGGELSWLLDHSFRRAASADWQEGTGSITYTTVRLVQFGHSDESSAQRQTTDQEGYAPDATGGTAVSVPGTVSGQVYAGTKNTGTNGSTNYEGRGYAVHGDIAVEVFVNSDHQVSAKTVLALLQSQLERL
ncbi:hypothetical protein [Streptacidiphilus sp. EB103A]|uniref:hypothetical protein n=1 Tax=Streptacidiphilus sp. EB103A TaxID=3156275 RepID=UPI003515316F